MSGQARTSSRNSKVDTKGAAGGGAGDASARRKLSSSGESTLATKQSDAAASSPAMKVLEQGDVSTVSSRSSSRLSLGSRSRSNLGQVPPRNESSLSQRAGTPTKHVALTAVRRKQDSDYDLPVEPELDWREFTRSNSSLNRGALSHSNSFQLSETSEEETPNHVEYTELASAKVESHVLSEDRDGVSEVTVRMEAVELKKGEDRSQDTEDKKDSSDDDDDDDDDSDEEPRKAPNELLMEFLDCIMKKDFKNAEKLCRMILIYEPNHTEALSFQPVIQEKLRLEQEAAEAGEEESGEEGEDDDEDDDDDDEDDDDDDSDDDSSLEDSSDDDDDNDENNEEAAAQPPRPDSGIGM